MNLSRSVGPDMATFEEIVENGVKEGDIPGIVLLARDRDGIFSPLRGCFTLSNELRRKI